MTELIYWVLVFAIIGATLAACLAFPFIILRPRRRPGTLPPSPCTSAHPRCAHTAKRLTEARAGMMARGTRLLIKNRPAWQKLCTTPTAEAAPKAAAVVIPLRRK